jgi:hypothetical protein
MFDVALAAIGLAAPVEAILYIWKDRNRRVEIAQRRIKLAGLDIGARTSDVEDGQVLAQRNGLVEIGQCVGPGFLVVLQTAARGIGNRILRFQLDRPVDVDKRQVKFSGPLPCISARQQGRNRLGIELQCCIRIGRGRIEFGPACQKPRPAHKGLHPIVRRLRGIVDHLRAGGLDLVSGIAAAILDIARLCRPRLPAQRHEKQ